jgi:DNA ligase (NAD+)
VEQLVSLGYVRHVADLFTLRSRQHELEQLERWGEKSTSNLLDAIEKSKSQPFARALFALGIRHVGAGVAKLLTDQFPSMQALQEATEEQLLATHQIGPAIAASVVHFFADKHNRDIVRRLEVAGVTLRGARRPHAGAFAGKTFVLTGTLPGHTREEATVIIESNGGTVSSSVSRNTSYLLAGDDAGSKLAKAKSLKVPVINESEFLRMLKRGAHV